MSGVFGEKSGRKYRSDVDRKVAELARLRRYKERKRVEELLVRVVKERPELERLAAGYVELREEYERKNRALRPIVEEILFPRKRWDEVTNAVRRKMERDKERVKRWRQRKKLVVAEEAVSREEGFTAGSAIPAETSTVRQQKPTTRDILEEAWRASVEDREDNSEGE